MNKPVISFSEYEKRIESIREKMQLNNVDALLVYGDEFRRENLRYVSNYWPIFDRGMLVIPSVGEPILLTAPESKGVAQEMSVWKDIRNTPDMCAGYIDDTIDYPFADYHSLRSVADELRSRGDLRKIGLVGSDAMCHNLFLTIQESFGVEIKDMDKVFYQIREIKTAEECACMREAGRIAQAGIKALLSVDLVGLSETEACGIAEMAARRAGAEAFAFTLCSSGHRTDFVVPRASTRKTIEDGDMVSIGLAVMYEGYTATCQIPFAVGNFSSETRNTIDALIRAWDTAMPQLRPGNSMKKLVTAVRDQFRAEKLDKYDLYPPMHGSGLAEAENPYPDETTERVFQPGMCFNTDISLFGSPGGSNRIEAGYIVTVDGYEPITPFVDEYCRKWLSERQNWHAN